MSSIIKILGEIIIIWLIVTQTSVVCQDFIIDIDVPVIDVIEPSTTEKADTATEKETEVTTEKPIVDSETTEDDSSTGTQTLPSTSSEISTDSPEDTISVSTGRPSIGILPSVPVGSVVCVKETHEGCNLTNLERCVVIRERASRCVCLAGYARATDGYSCVGE